MNSEIVQSLDVKEENKAKMITEKIKLLYLELKAAHEEAESKAQEAKAMKDKCNTCFEAKTLIDALLIEISRGDNQYDDMRSSILSDVYSIIQEHNPYDRSGNDCTKPRC